MTDVTGYIVVGVDGSASSIRALSWAVAQGVLTGAEVHAIITWQYPTVYGAFPMGDEVDWEGMAKDTMDDALESADADTSKVLVRVVEGHAAKVLVAASATADVLVVGNRGHGGFRELLLGSVSIHVVTHATCPVLVRHPPTH
ncbi:MAG: universal stress protein [Lapillicoccus sp.]